MLVSQSIFVTFEGEERQVGCWLDLPEEMRSDERAIPKQCRALRVVTEEELRHAIMPNKSGGMAMGDFRQLLATFTVWLSAEVPAPNPITILNELVSSYLEIQDSAATFRNKAKVILLNVDEDVLVDPMLKSMHGSAVALAVFFSITGKSMVVPLTERGLYCYFGEKAL